MIHQIAGALGFREAPDQWIYEPLAQPARHVAVAVTDMHAQMTPVPSVQLIASESRERDLDEACRLLTDIVTGNNRIIGERLIECGDDVLDDIADVRLDVDLVVIEPIALRNHTRVCTLVDER